MNLILLETTDYISPNRVRLNDYRFQHIREVHRATEGDELRVGLLNGPIGKGCLIEMTGSFVTMEVQLEDSPPAPLPATLLLALPRPKMLKRILQSISSLGVKEIYLINSYRVDKSYWSTPILTEDNLTEHLKLGLEQSVDTQLPTVHLRKRFKPFVEDELPDLVKGKRALVAHPYQAASTPTASLEPTVLAIGPEGGFIPYEIEKLQEVGFNPIELGQRILRVETAIPFSLSKLFPLV